MEFSLAFNGDIELIQKANSINLIECYFHRITKSGW